MITLEEAGRHLVALEGAQTSNAATMKWMVGTLGQIQAAVDGHTDTLAGHSVILGNHTAVLHDHTKRLDRIEGEMRGIRTDVRGLVSSMPQIVAIALRDVLKERPA